jgi:hypothetical protein
MRSKIIWTPRRVTGIWKLFLNESTKSSFKMPAF